MNFWIQIKTADPSLRDRLGFDRWRLAYREDESRSQNVTVWPFRQIEQDVDTIAHGSDDVSEAAIRMVVSIPSITRIALFVGWLLDKVGFVGVEEIEIDQTVIEFDEGEITRFIRSKLVDEVSPPS